MSDSPRAGTADAEQFEELLAAVVSRLATCADAVFDETLTACLGDFVEFFGFDRGTLMVLSQADGGLHVSHAWWREGVPPIPPKARVDAEMPWLAHQMRTGNILAFSSLGDLPAEAAREREFLLTAGQKSGIAIPLLVAESAFGAITFGSFDEERHWPRSLVVRLRLAGMALGLGLQRHQYRQELALLAEALAQRAADRAGWTARRAEQLRRLAAHLIRTESKERLRMAETVHEDIMQTLAAATMRIRSTAGRTHGEQWAGISGSIDMLMQTIGKLRLLAADLHPLGIQAKGTVEALRWLAGQMRDLHGLAVEVSAASDVDPVPDDICLFLHQSARELLENVAAHAHANRATVDICRVDPAHVRLLVADNGTGFDVSRLRDIPNCQFGLFSIYERAELMGGTLEVNSQVGRGTRAVLTVPV